MTTSAATAESDFRVRAGREWPDPQQPSCRFRRWRQRALRRFRLEAEAFPAPSQAGAPCRRRALLDSGVLAGLAVLPSEAGLRLRLVLRVNCRIALLHSPLVVFAEVVSFIRPRSGVASDAAACIVGPFGIVKKRRLVAAFRRRVGASGQLGINFEKHI